MVRRKLNEDILGAIDVGTNAVRLELARVLPDGSLETLHTERDPVRPGEGLFKSGVISREVATLLIATLRRYQMLCARYGARVRAVATSAFREARNREELVRRIKREAGLTLDVISGREEARLICLGVLQGKPPKQRSLCIDIGGGSTEVIFAEGEQPRELWSVDLGAVRLTELFEVKDSVPRKKLGLMRDYAREMLEGRVKTAHGLPPAAVGSSGTIGAIVAFAKTENLGHATVAQISRAVDALAAMNAEKRRRRFDPRRADIVLAGAVVLEAAMLRLGVKTITAVDRGLREGILFDLVRRRGPAAGDDHSLADAARALGRRFHFGEAHATQVSRLALRLFDELATLHQLPAAARPYLEAAALLHDIGHAVNVQKHHKHTHYLILNSDLPGLSDRERQLVALIARFHRRTRPEPQHELMAPLTPADYRLVRKCVVLLRVADSLDRSHQQPVREVVASVKGRVVQLGVRARRSAELELWDLQHEVDFFREVFGKPLQVALLRSRSR